MNFNPFRTLAGRLVFVTIIAIAISHILAFALFTNERGNSFRRFAENSLVERVVGIAQYVRDLTPAEQADATDAASDFSNRFSIVTDPQTSAATGAAPRLAREISQQLNGAETRGRARVVEIRVPRRVRIFAPEDDRPPRDRIRDGREERDWRPPGGQRDEPKREREVTEVTIDVALSEGRWLRAIGYLPAPRPIPRETWIGALASLIAVALGAFLISRQIGRPLAKLAQAAERLGAGDTSATVPVSGPEDVRRASTAFNAMAERLGRQMDRQRQMLWALSHDLRTPITALKLRAELVEDDATRQRLTGPIAEMELMTEQALALARAGASQEPRTEVDLAEIARTLCGELQDIGINARAEADTPVLAKVRPSEIARAMRNLAENAAKHGGGGVMRAFRGAKGEAIVEVRDEGPGLAPDLLARVTQPFFRADSARGGGTGLGLAIAQAIADSHGGRLELQNLTPHGLSAKLILPA